MKLKKVLCAALAALMLTSVSSAAFADAQGHWAGGAIERWNASGVVTGGSDGLFHPNQSITRGQMAVILTAVCGWREETDVTFTDMSGEEWFAPYVRKAYAAGAMAGADGKIRPNDSITRQEAAVMLYKALHIPAVQGDKVFADQSDIAAWAADQVAAMAAGGYITGAPDGRFIPGGYITRAETVTILNKAVPGFYNRAGAYSRDVARAVVRAPGVTLQNMTVAGDLIVAPGATGAETTLYNLTVGGRTIVECDAKGLVEVGGTTVLDVVQVLGVGGRIKLGENTKISSLAISAGDVRITGVERGTEVTVAEGCEKVFVNGHQLTPGTWEAEKGDDPFVGGPIIDVVIQ